MIVAKTASQTGLRAQVRLEERVCVKGGGSHGHAGTLQAAHCNSSNIEVGIVCSHVCTGEHIHHHLCCVSSIAVLHPHLAHDG